MADPAIPIIDLFAGPGGLNEGFCRVRDSHGRKVFDTIVSVERDSFAHQTLELRALFRRLESERDRKIYFQYVTGEISRSDLFEKVGAVVETARNEAFLGELGKPSVNKAVEERIEAALRKAGTKECVLIGGPPCQAYSLVGRARRAREAREEFEADPKHRLYLQYLKILRRFHPTIFLMENVPGLLSAKWRENATFDLICDGLRGEGYELFALGSNGSQGELFSDVRDYLLRSEEHGVPQCRSRLFIVGVRNDIGRKPNKLLLDPNSSKVTTDDALSDLPAIRSRISREPDSATEWKSAVEEIAGYAFNHLEDGFASSLKQRAHAISEKLPLGAPVMRAKAAPKVHASWYSDPLLEVVLNHNSRGHMRRDLLRYFFWAEFGRYYKRSPTLRDAPHFLRPNHANAAGAEGNTPFADRFRVQIADRPSTTITSHIAKDGHYYIHPDSMQCRSLSVREAARLQTFPDNYYFEGPVTEQYHQVGNAVPPLLANKIAQLLIPLIS